MENRSTPIPSLQIFRALCIVQLSRRFIMLAAVQLYRQTCRIAIKIQNIPSYNLLPYKARRISAQKIIPQMAFLPRHAFSQRSGIFKDILVSRSLMVLLLPQFRQGVLQPDAQPLVGSLGRLPDALGLRSGAA